MTYKIPAPTVFLSFNDDINLTILNGSINPNAETYRELAKSDGIFIGGPNQDLQIKRFEHNIVGSSESGIATFEIIDPKHELENRILKSVNFDYAPSGS